MIRRVFLAGTVAASSRRVHVVLKVDVEPGTAPQIAQELEARLPGALATITAAVTGAVPSTARPTVAEVEAHAAAHPLPPYEIPEEDGGPRGVWMIRATGEESSPAAMIVEAYIKDGAAHWDAMTMGASYACGAIEDFEREHPWLHDVRWYPCDRNGDVVARSPT